MRSHLQSWSVWLALAGMAAILPGSGWCGAPRIYLSWRAPYGSPGASDTLTTACGRGGEKDTLYLTFETGEDSGGYFGTEAVLYFRAPVGDTLGPHWWFDRKNLEVQFVADSVPGCVMPWQSTISMMTSFYDRSPGSGRLRLSNIRPISLPVVVRDSVPYFYARILIPRPRADVPRCDQPICVEWFIAEVCTDTTATAQKFSGPGGNRFISWNSPNGEVCSSFRSLAPATARAPAAKPKKPPRSR